jgi:hypothetical protein
VPISSRTFGIGELGAATARRRYMEVAAMISAMTSLRSVLAS